MDPDSDHPDLAYVTTCDLEELERFLSDGAVQHGGFFTHNRDETITAIHTHHTGKPTNSFTGIRIDTCANHRSSISISQYDAYCDEFALKSAIRMMDGVSVRGIGGSQTAILMAKIQMNFA